MLAMGLGLLASPAAAAPFAYVANNETVSVIDTATTPPSVVATIPTLVGGLCCNPLRGGVAVTPDGKYAYVTGDLVSVIDTATNMVVANINLQGTAQGVAITPDGKYAYVTVPSPPADVAMIATATNTLVAIIPVEPGPLDAWPVAVAVTPDGKHAYIADQDTNDVSVIDTATNTVVGTPIPVGAFPRGIAVTPDGKHAYVANINVGTVSVIDTATNMVVATVAVGSRSLGVAVTPDGKHAYVANLDSNNVSVIDTATNTVVATVTVGVSPTGVAVTPDGKHAYITNGSSNNVSVIDTVTNTVVATVTVGDGPIGVGIMPPPVGVPFLAFSAKLAITFGGAPNEDSFNLHSSFTLSSTAPALHPHRDPVTLQVGTFSITIPPRSFREQPDGSFTFAGVISGVSLKAQIYHTGTLQYEFHAKAMGASLTAAMKPVYVTLIIGADTGVTPVENLIFY
jgi:YVTN family beta-propeller protein